MPSKPKKLTHKFFIATGVVMSLVIFTILGSFYLISTYTANYARYTAEPIEAALIKAGAVKKCSVGDSGRGVDNRRPNYSTVFETRFSRAEAADLVSRATSFTNYKLQVDNSYENIVSYYDDKAPSPYRELREGTVIVGLSLYDGGHQLNCGKTQIKYDKSNTAIKLDVSLPEYK